jgi:hypothetical protein
MKFAFFAVVTGLVPIFALAILPYRNREMFALVPAVLRRPFLGVPRSTVLAAVTLAYFLWMILASFLFPAAGVDNPVGTLSLLIFMVASGLLVFEVRRRKKLAEINIDIARIKKQPSELPRGKFG